MQKRVPFITFCIKPAKKAWINLAGCNFDCKGCFALAKEEVGRPFSADELTNFYIQACQHIYGDIVTDLVITGGEPTLNRAYLINLIKRLRENSATKIALSTNGYLLDENLIHQLKILEVDLVKLDIKAFSEDVHYWYTGKSNRNVLKAAKLLYDYDVNFYVRTILMPGVVDMHEVEMIAEFLSSISPEIPYRIYEFDPKHAKQPVSRKPSLKEMSEAFKVAKRHLKCVESIPASEVYDSSFEYIEVREDTLQDKFNRIDEISKLSIKDWKIRSIPFSKILSG